MDTEERYLATGGRLLMTCSMENLDKAKVQRLDSEVLACDYGDILSQNNQDNQLVVLTKTGIWLMV